MIGFWSVRHATGPRAKRGSVSGEGSGREGGREGTGAR